MSLYIFFRKKLKNVSTEKFRGISSWFMLIFHKIPLFYALGIDFSPCCKCGSICWKLLCYMTSHLTFGFYVFLQPFYKNLLELKGVHYTASLHGKLSENSTHKITRYIFISVAVAGLLLGTAPSNGVRSPTSTAGYWGNNIPKVNKY